MRKAIIAAAALVALASNAQAYCTGSGSYSNCYDTRTGNSYTIQRYGDTTYMNGHNNHTGSSWSQQSNTYGSTTFHNGRDSRGNSWSTTCVNGYCN